MLTSTAFWMIGLPGQGVTSSPQKPVVTDAKILQPTVLSVADLKPHTTTAGDETTELRPQVLRVKDLKPTPGSAQDLRPKTTETEED